MSAPKRLKKNEPWDVYEEYFPNAYRVYMYFVLGLNLSVELMHVFRRLWINQKMVYSWSEMQLLQYNWFKDSAITSDRIQRHLKVDADKDIIMSYDENRSESRFVFINLAYRGLNRMYVWEGNGYYIQNGHTKSQILLSDISKLMADILNDISIYWFYISCNLTEKQFYIF